MFKLTKSKLKALSTLSANFSEVFLASLVIPILMGGVDKYRLPLLILGLAGTIIAALLSAIFAEKGKL